MGFIDDLIFTLHYFSTFDTCMDFLINETIVRKTLIEKVKQLVTKNEILKIQMFIFN
jgi:hypothetical protein